MLIKQSLEENKQTILNSLPTEELKQQFLNSLENIQEPPPPTFEQQVKEAEAQPHVTEEMYAGIQSEIEAGQQAVAMTPEEEKAAIEEALKNPPTSGEEG